MFRLKYNSIIFYVYNLDKFNIIFIIRVLFKYNKINDSNNLIIKKIKYNKTDKKIQDFNNYKLNIIYKNNIILNIENFLYY